jgi:hypothetical protein
MKLNHELIRNLLINIEELEINNGLNPENEEERYHMVLLIESELVNGFIETLEDNSEHPYIFRLTWEGHQFLELIRNDTVWSKIKAKMEKIGSFSLPIVQGLGIEYIKAMIQ